MPTLEETIALAVEAHRGQVDHVNQPYILHPLRVMFRLEEEADRVVAVLHDVIEDTGLTLEDLRRKGYGEDILAALDGVTRREGESYEDFVERSLAHPVSRRVKLADLEDNMDIRRLSTPLDEKDFNRLRRYRRAWDRLKSEATG
jgi:(p)ppGpp synthase/HD superfamily hydrolase